ncbi:MAG: biotin/lipoyl-containing protein, partial [Aestuariivirga sp.]
MAKEIRVPALGESVTEATIAKWFKNVGDAVKADEPMVELETDKVTVEVPAPASGKLTSIAAAAGTTVNVGALLGAIEEGAAGAAAKPAAAAPVAAPAPAKIAEPVKAEAPLSPAVRKIVTENKLDPTAIPATGRDGRLTKG